MCDLVLEAWESWLAASPGNAKADVSGWLALLELFRHDAPAQLLGFRFLYHQVRVGVQTALQTAQTSINQTGITASRLLSPCTASVVSVIRIISVRYKDYQCVASCCGVPPCHCCWDSAEAPHDTGMIYGVPACNMTRSHEPTSAF